MNKILIVGLLGILLVGCIIIINIENENGGINYMEEKSYQGPVRPGDDEAYFRKTGVTKPLEVIR